MNDERLQALIEELIEYIRSKTDTSYGWSVEISGKGKEVWITETAKKKM